MPYIFDNQSFLLMIPLALLLMMTQSYGGTTQYICVVVIYFEIIFF